MTSCLGRADYTCNVLLVWGERGLLPLRHQSQSMKTAVFWRYLSPMSMTRRKAGPHPRRGTFAFVEMSGFLAVLVGYGQPGSALRCVFNLA